MVEKLRVAICGSEEQYWKPEQRTQVVKKIVKIFRKHATNYNDGNAPEYDYNMILISGGCPKGGVDIWAEIVADVLEIEKDIHRPEINQWESTFADFGDDPNKSSFRHLKGYKERNMEIAEICDILYCIDPKWRGEKTGAQWTMRYAIKARKETHLVQIE